MVITGDFKVPELARVLKTSPSWVYGKIRSGDIIAYRLPGNRLLRIPASELARFQVPESPPTESATE